MVECGAQEIGEDLMIEALEFGHKSIQPLINIKEKMAAEIGKPKKAYTSYALDEALVDQVHERIASQISQVFESKHDKAELYGQIETLQAEVVASMAAEDASMTSKVKEAYDEAVKRVMRKRILENNLRPDGRGLKDIRPIWCEVDVSPRAHGSGLFTRGETQVLTLATLGTPRDAQELDNLTPTDTKRYMHHYNFPPFSTGEVKSLRGSSRREIGHGALAERALVPVIPSEETFPYTLRLVSEVLSSNGSTSMASVCGSTLALMDTGVPIKAPVSGVAMGLVKEGDQHAILTDIMGMEDHLGDMDFKVAGTRYGITALQMDIKIKGIDTKIMSAALEQARKARISILEEMLKVIAEPREELKPHAPHITIVRIPIDKIGAVIGPGGKVIRNIQEVTGVTVDINDEGLVYISATDGKSADMAREMVESLTETPEVGRIYTGKVVRIADFGAFVEILPNVDGMVHISQLDTERVNRVEDVVGMGDEITVMITGIDPQGKIRLSRQAVLEGWTVEEAAQRDRGGRGSSSKSGGNRPGGRSNDRRSRDRDRRY